jgi:hypothetical protein
LGEDHVQQCTSPILPLRDFPLDQQRLFSDIVDFSTQFLRGHITLYSIDPLGAAEAGGFRPFYWREFAGGIRKPSQARPGDLGLEVLAAQSGGLALSSNNDITSLLQQCIDDRETYYELSFNPPVGESNEYHRLGIRLSKHGLKARTRQGYYSEKVLEDKHA